jgi:hypothetical protein
MHPLEMGPKDFETFAMPSVSLYRDEKREKERWMSNKTS